MLRRPDVPRGAGRRWSWSGAPFPMPGGLPPRQGMAAQKKAPLKPGGAGVYSGGIVTEAQPVVNQPQDQPPLVDWAARRAAFELTLPPRPDKPPATAPKDGRIWDRYRRTKKNWEERCRRLRREAGIPPLTSKEGSDRSKLAKRAEKGEVTVAELVDAGMLGLASKMGYGRGEWLPPPDPTLSEGGRMSEYTQDVASTIIIRVARGQTLTQICAEPSMPSLDTWRGWVLRYPDLRDAYESAKRMKAAVLFDEALDLVRWLKNQRFLAGDAVDVNAKRVALQGLQTAAGKLDPQQFGDRSLTVPSLTIQINTNLDLGAGPREELSSGDGAMFAYTIQAKSPPVLDASVSDKEPDESAPKDSPGEARRMELLPQPLTEENADEATR